MLNQPFIHYKKAEKANRQGQVSTNQHATKYDYQLAVECSS